MTSPESAPHGTPENPDGQPTGEQPTTPAPTRSPEAPEAPEAAEAAEAADQGAPEPADQPAAAPTDPTVADPGAEPASPSAPAASAPAASEPAGSEPAAESEAALESEVAAEPADVPAPASESAAEVPAQSAAEPADEPAPAPEPAPEVAAEVPTGPAPAPEPAPEAATPPAPAPEPAPEAATGPAPAPEPAPAASSPAPRPAPRPGPRRGPRPGPRPGPPKRPVATPAPPAPEVTAAETEARTFGRVADDGTVFVRTPEGERAVGQMPDATADEALSFFVKRYVDLVFEVELLERRVGAGTLAPDEAAASVKQVRTAAHEAQAVGDLAGLEARLDALTGTIGQQRERRREERSRKQKQAQVEKERIAEEAERLSQGSDWRNGANRMRQLLDEWKVLPRLEKSADDALWRRFSTARTTYTRRRKSHFAELNEQRDEAQAVKEKLVVEAEALADSTDWGPTAAKYRDLMNRWKAAGPAPKGIDDALWKRFRGAQDTFFGARDSANAELDREFAANAVAKEALLAEAEALVPVTNLRAAKDAFRNIAERWDAAGKVPRERMKDLEGRMRKVEQAIRGTEDDQWRRSNPEARARAADTVAQLEASLADLQAKHDKAVVAGNAKKAAEHASAIEARRSWLAEAQRALKEFSG